ncbi:hypothetical protein OG21DRAFT_1606556 [Imleria badia]|nr:hypothetical protein OG21DRAFT_1606556 [Imleria badia]
MTDDDVRRWLTDDPVVLVVVATSLAIALTSYLWLNARTVPDDSRSVLSAAFATLHVAVARAVPQQQSLALAAPADEQQDRKSTRSKERRRRGKDPFRDLLKGGKKSNALLNAIKATDCDRSPPSADTLSNSSTPQNDSASSTSRSQSPEPVSDRLDMGMEPHDVCARSTTPNGNTSSTSAADISDRDSLDTDSQTDDIRTLSLPPDSMTATDTEADVISPSMDAPSSPPVPPDVLTPQPRDAQAAYTSGSCAKLVRARTKLRLSRLDPSVKSGLLLSTPSPLPDSVASPFNSVQSIVRCPSTHSADGAGPSTPTNSRGSTPPPRSLSMSENPVQRERNTQPLDQCTVMQLASMRSALEAARLREQQLRAEAEQASKQRDELRWGWNEDAGVWRRREAELQAQIHHLMQQLHAYAAVASFQAQQVSSSYSSPTSPHAHSSPRLQHHPLVSFPLPPAFQTQNSASAPAHVQALLASAPMLTSHSPGFAAPSGGVYAGTGFGMSPLLWSGPGLCVPNRDTRQGGRRTPDSSASGSSPRGRQRRAENAQSPSDESSMGDWDGMEDGSGDEDPWEDEEEDIFRNNVLADAILKRPESIRGLSSVGKRRPPMQGMGEMMNPLKDPVEKPG